MTGEIDSSNAEELARVVVDTLRAHRPQRLRLDLDGVTFLGAAGARALMRGRIAADRVGCALEIGRTEARVEKVLALCGVRADPLPSGAGSGPA
ncbi:MAG: STAS domain-containing protein [Saccharothrix sp.]|nr:STAS domain-containing protein [Saccharothrix sp.]